MNLKEATPDKIRSCEIIIVCLPPLMVAPWIQQHANDFADNAIITDAAGVKGVIIPEDRSAGVTPAAVRASAGAAEHLCVVKVVNIVRAIEALKEQEVWVTGLDFGDDAKDYADIDYKGRCGLVVGNEGRGISRLVREKCDFIAMLPMVGAVSSLNASVAGALVMYEALRQKR